MQVDEASASWKSEYMGKTYDCWRQGCKATFDANPAQYTAEGSEHQGHGDSGH